MPAVCQVSPHAAAAVADADADADAMPGDAPKRAHGTAMHGTAMQISFALDQTSHLLNMTLHVRPLLPCSPRSHAFSL
jgi:hypothetical protein